MKRNEVFKKLLDRKMNMHSDINILLVSHNDMDGYGPEIILKSLFYKNVDTLHVSNNSMDKSILWAALNEENDKYDYILITDISCSEETARKISMSKNKDKIILLDHHVTADYLNKYDFAVVAQEHPDDSFTHKLYKRYCEKNHIPVKNGLASGTTLLLDYIYELEKLNLHSTNILMLEEICFTIGIFDTWDWVNVFNSRESASKLNKLFYLLGEEDFVSIYLHKIEQNEEYSFSLFSEDEEIILARENKKCEHYISGKDKIIKTFKYKINDKDYLICSCRAERFISELFDHMENKYPDVDFYLIDTGSSISFRSTNEIDVSEIAKSFGGGGHIHAAGVSYDSSKSIDFIKSILS